MTWKRWLFICVLVTLICSQTAWSKTPIKVYYRNVLQEVQWLTRVTYEFEAANPNIGIELIPGPGGAPYAERLAVLWAGGNAPDVFYGAADKAGFILNGWTLDISRFLQRDAAEMRSKDFFAGVFDASTRSGRNMGVPAMAMPTSIFYNRTLFAKAGLANPPVDWDDPGWNWDDFVSYCRKLTLYDADGRTTQAAIYNLGLSDVLWISGGDYWSEEAYDTGVADHITLVTDIAIQTASRIQDLNASGYVATSPRSAVSGGLESGQTAMQWAGWWRVRDYLKVPFEWGIAPLPRVKSRSNVRCCDPWFIASTTTHPEEAWAFVKHVTGTQAQLSYGPAVGMPPSRQSAVGSYLEAISGASGMSRSELLAGLSGALKHSRSATDEVIGGQSIVLPMIAEEVTPMLKSLRGVREALEAAEYRVNAALGELVQRWRR